jgi:hypothetical protein
VMLSSEYMIRKLLPTYVHLKLVEGNYAELELSIASNILPMYYAVCCYSSIASST